MVIPMPCTTHLSPTVLSRTAAGLRLFAALAVIFVAGCGDGTDPVSVEGVVTLDGSPLVGATVMFRPEEGRPSAGTTDAEGRYRLRYTSERAGAVPGQHVVSITMLDDGGDDDAPKKKREPIPARYNAKSELVAEVTGSKVKADFALESK
jgi:hypothetical protein